MPASTAAPLTGAAAVAGTTVYAAGGNGRVYAFDKEIGTPIWSTQIADTAANQFIWSSAFPVNGRVYVGIANETESSVCDENPGRVVSLDGATGAGLGTRWAARARRPTSAKAPSSAPPTRTAGSSSPEAGPPTGTRARSPRSIRRPDPSCGRCIPTASSFRR